MNPAVADALYQAQLEREARGEHDYAEYQLNYDYPDTYAGQIDFMVKEKKHGTELRIGWYEQRRH